jgi:hypothetical protein
LIFQPYPPFNPPIDLHGFKVGGPRAISGLSLPLSESKPD